MGLAFFLLKKFRRAAIFLLIRSRSPLQSSPNCCCRAIVEVEQKSDSSSNCCPSCDPFTRPSSLTTFTRSAGIWTRALTSCSQKCERSSARTGWFGGAACVCRSAILLGFFAFLLCILHVLFTFVPPKKPPPLPARPPPRQFFRAPERSGPARSWSDRREGVWQHALGLGQGPGPQGPGMGSGRG